VVPGTSTRWSEISFDEGARTLAEHQMVFTQAKVHRRRVGQHATRRWKCRHPPQSSGHSGAPYQVIDVVDAPGRATSPRSECTNAPPAPRGASLPSEAVANVASANTDRATSSVRGLVRPPMVFASTRIIPDGTRNRLEIPTALVEGPAEHSRTAWRD